MICGFTARSREATGDPKLKSGPKQHDEDIKRLTIASFFTLFFCWLHATLASAAAEAAAAAATAVIFGAFCSRVLLFMAIKANYFYDEAAK